MRDDLQSGSTADAMLNRTSSGSYEMGTTMRAAVCTGAGGPEVLELRELPVPAVREGWSLVLVKGAGLNRSELRTRQGHSPNVTFPRVLGIECVGIVAASTDPMLPDGTTVAAGMRSMRCCRTRC
jgi:NADPH:quinone reductase-like Zn-dependent oxidoreductase